MLFQSSTNVDNTGIVMVPHVENNNCIGAPVISGRTKTCTDVFFLSSFRGLTTRISSN